MLSIQRFEILGSGSARPNAERIAFCDGTDDRLIRPETDLELSDSSFTDASETKPRVLARSADSDRTLGYDLARSWAILGMILVHFSLVMASDPKSPVWLAVVLDALDGRAAATFMVLAGVGITLITKKAVESHDPARLRGVRRLLVNRGLFLFVLGCLNLTIWPGDILRVYGVTFLMAAWWFTVSSRTLLVLAAAFALGFMGLMLGFDFEQNWDWSTMTYHHLWTTAGFLRNLLFDGFRSIFPWSGFMLFGMWLGRIDLREAATNRRLLWVSLLILLFTETASWLCVNAAVAAGLDLEAAKALFGTASMPALPFFLTTAISTALLVITVSVRLGTIPRLREWLQPFADVGRMALTWYFAHIILGLGTIVMLEEESQHTLSVAMLTGLLFYTGAVFMSWLWMRRFRFSPLESLMRRICG